MKKSSGPARSFSDTCPVFSRTRSINEEGGCAPLESYRSSAARPSGKLRKNEHPHCEGLHLRVVMPPRFLPCCFTSRMRSPFFSKWICLVCFRFHILPEAQP